KNKFEIEVDLQNLREIIKELRKEWTIKGLMKESCFKYNQIIRIIANETTELNRLDENKDTIKAKIEYLYKILNIHKSAVITTDFAGYSDSFLASYDALMLMISPLLEYYNINSDSKKTSDSSSSSSNSQNNSSSYNGQNNSIDDDYGYFVCDDSEDSEDSFMGDTNSYVYTISNFGGADSSY
ncbi:MAG: hypothetical protein AABY27_01855, partial [Pseudomonadota bacterium]